MEMTNATPEAIASLSEAQCREALLLACKVACDLFLMNGLRSAQYMAIVERLETLDSHKTLLYGEALKATQDVSQLRREMEQKTKECDDLVNGIKSAADRLSNLGSDMTSKPVTANHKETKLPPQLVAAIANVNQALSSERSKTKRLQDQVKYFKKQLDACRETDSSEDVKDLQAQLDAAKAASAAKNTANELAEKLRCQICMDRQRDTAFACGHTCCKQCSVKWEKCTFNCVSERRQKPVKFTFPLYFN